MRERESECHYRVTVMNEGGVIWEIWNKRMKKTEMRIIILFGS